MAKGGARPGAGRKAKAKIPAAASKRAAEEILDFLALQKNPHHADKNGIPCRCLNCRWRVLSDAMDLRLRFHVERALLDRVHGLPSQTIEHSGHVTLEQLVCGVEGE